MKIESRACCRIIGLTDTKGMIEKVKLWNVEFIHRPDAIILQQLLHPKKPAHLVSIRASTVYITLPVARLCKRSMPILIVYKTKWQKWSLQNTAFILSP